MHMRKRHRPGPAPGIHRRRTTPVSGDGRLAMLQLLADESPGVRRLGRLRGLLQSGVIQRTRWRWTGQYWEADPADQVYEDDYPEDKGKKVGEIRGEIAEKGGSEEEEDSSSEEPYSQREILDNGTIIDFPALNTVMQGVQIGVVVQPAEWRQMRQDLSDAITLPNKSHPAHGSNFNKKQRPEQQIADWANPISGELKERLARYFLDQHNVYI